MKKRMQILVNGIFKENPVLVLVLGCCSVLAISVTVKGSLGMGAALTFVLVGSNVVISLLRNIIPDKVRIPAFIAVICTFVTIVQMFMQAFLHDLYESLGVFIPLIVVNCIILARAEAFASKNGVLASAVDGVGMGCGFTLAITCIAIIRELLGNGTIFGLNVFGAGYEPMLLMILAPGGFMVFGGVLAISNLVTQHFEKKKKDEKGVIHA